MAAGSLLPVGEIGLRSPAQGEASESAFVTWSAPRTAGYWACPGERKAFAVVIGEAIDVLNARHKSDVVVSCAVFREAHANGKHHLHAVVRANSPTKHWESLGRAIRAGARAAVHVQVCSGRGLPHVVRMLRYTMVPTASKPHVDQTPYLSSEFEVPQVITDARSRALTSLRNKPATNDEVYNFLLVSPGVADFESFMDAVNGDLDGHADSALMSRMGKFLSKNAKEAKKIACLLLERRDRKLNKQANCLTWAGVMDAARQADCERKSSELFAKQLLWSVTWHDSHERQCKDSKSLIGDFALALYLDSIVDRKENIFAVGVKGSGKTTVLNAFINLPPPHRVFRPAYDSGAPLAGLAPHHLLGNFNEFRCQPNVNSSTMLMLAERKPNLRVDVKHEAPTSLPNGGPRCVFSSNYLAPCAGWKEADIDRAAERLGKTPKRRAKQIASIALSA